MRFASASAVAALTLACLALACGPGSGDRHSVQAIAKPNGATLPVLTGPNVIPLSVNGAECAGDNTYPNKPCVSVTICAPGDAGNCQTVNNLLLDTGSVGLRVFKSVLHASLASALPQLTSGGKPLAACMQFGDGTSDWGPVQAADVVLGGEAPAPNVPIHVIDAGYAAVPSNCGAPDASPAQAGFNGILGVGLFQEDCGPGCAAHVNNGIYYTCQGASCANAIATASVQVQNIVPRLAADNNGVVLMLPDTGLGGARSLEGYLVLGIGTRANNQPVGVTAFAADGTGNFVTEVGGVPYSSFVDSGSNALFFPASLPNCGATNPSIPGIGGWYCPSVTTTLAATTVSANGDLSGDVEFQVGNTVSLLSSANNVFVELGHDGRFGSATVFDWGLPFFIGRNVYIGMEDRRSVLGSDMFWAY